MNYWTVFLLGFLGGAAASFVLVWSYVVQSIRRNSQYKAALVHLRACSGEGADLLQMASNMQEENSALRVRVAFLEVQLSVFELIAKSKEMPKSKDADIQDKTD